jgi:hypothetical protein
MEYALSETIRNNSVSVAQNAIETLTKSVTPERLRGPRHIEKHAAKRWPLIPHLNLRNAKIVLLSMIVI